MSFNRTNCKSKTPARSTDGQPSFRHGAVAWFGAQATASAAAKTAEASVTVTEHIAHAGGISVPLTVTLSSELANPQSLLLAQFKEYESDEDDAAYKKLETGYIDASGGFHHVLGSEIDEKYGLYAGGGTVETNDDAHYVMSSTLKVTIAINWDAEYSSGNKHWTGTPGSRTFTTNGSDSYTELNVIQTLQNAAVDIGLKDISGERGRLFDTVALTGNPLYVTTNSANLTDGYYFKAANQNKPLAGLAYTNSAVDENATIEFGNLVNYYIYGHNGGAGDNGTLESAASVTISDTFGVKVKPHG